MSALSIKIIRSSARCKLGACLLLALTADTFFFHHNAGWVTGAFVFLVMSAVLFFNPFCFYRHIGIIAATLTFGQCLILINQPSIISYMLTLAGLVTLALISCGAHYHDAAKWKDDVIKFIEKSIFRGLEDARIYYKVIKRKKIQEEIFKHILQMWTLPLVMTFIFIFLLSSANPVIDMWLNAIYWDDIWAFFSWPQSRVLLWFSVILCCWPLLRPRIPKVKHINKNVRSSAILWLFSIESITRSLIIFNFLFVLQTSMDIAYLWGGTKLPSGMTYAQYAHNGAYALMMTTSLAAIFVLIAMRPKSDSEQSATVRALVYAWVAQNLLLVFSSIWRINLYMQEYELTYLRFTALIWMGLIACGLILIVMRIALLKSNTWLINMNALILLAALYACSIINIGQIIANYNVRHCKEITGQGVNLDFSYLVNIGPSALPALEWLSSAIDTQSPDDVLKINPRYNIRNTIRTLRSRLDGQQNDWRAWTFQNYRLLKQDKMTELP